MLPSVVGTQGHLHDVGEISSWMPIWKTRSNGLLGCGVISGVARNRVPVGTSSWQAESCQELLYLLFPIVSQGQAVAAVLGASFKHRFMRNSVPSSHMRCSTTPMRRATATVARFCPRRLATFNPHALSQHGFARCISTVAALNNAVRNDESPAFVIRPETSRSPDYSLRGVRPAHGPISRDELNRLGSSIADRTVSATTAPTPGIVIISLHASS